MKKSLEQKQMDMRERKGIPRTFPDRDTFGLGYRRKDATEWHRGKHASINTGRHSIISTGTVGAIGELRACSDLLSKGYAVFRSVSPACFCDLVIAKDGRLTTVEVRTGTRTTKGDLYYSKENRAEVMAIVLPDEIVYLPALERKQG
jgi:hypothetical protein